VKVLLLTEEFPLPVDAGGVRRQLGLCSALSDHHSLHLLARLRRPTDASLVARLRDQLGASVEVFPQRGPSPRGVAPKALRWGRSIVHHVPPWMLTHPSPELARRALELAPGFDVAVTLDDIAHAYVRTLHRAVPVVLDKHNVQGASFAGIRPWGSAPAGRALHALTLAQLRRWERLTARLAGAVVVTTEAEADRFARLYGARPYVVPSCIPPPPATADPAHAERAVAWVGDLGYAPNADGLVRFVEEGWRPLGESGVRLLVAGRRPPERVRALGRVPGVEVLGFVEDLPGLLRGCAAAVVPLWSGAGIKMKTLELMGAGLPVAGTPVGFEGVDVADGVDALEAERSVDLAAALARLLDDRSLGYEIGRRARERVLREHTWDSVIGRFEDALAHATAGHSGPAGRAAAATA
jgi:glycosyltransferase involved in cell wall biosynthesis